MPAKSGIDMSGELHSWEILSFWEKFCHFERNFASHNKKYTRNCGKFSSSCWKFDLYIFPGNLTFFSGLIINWYFSICFVLCITQLCRIPRGTHHSHWKVVRGCATFKNPFTGHFFTKRSTDPHFQALFQLKRPHCYFWQTLHFQVQFSSISAKFQLLRHTFWRKFVPETPVSLHFQAKKLVPETLLLKTWAAHTYQKKKKKKIWSTLRCTNSMWF